MSASGFWTGPLFISLAARIEGSMPAILLRALFNDSSAMQTFLDLWQCHFGGWPCADAFLLHAEAVEDLARSCWTAESSWGFAAGASPRGLCRSAIGTGKVMFRVGRAVPARSGRSLAGICGRAGWPALATTQQYQRCHAAAVADDTGCQIARSFVLHGRCPGSGLCRQRHLRPANRFGHGAQCSGGAQREVSVAP